MLRSMGRAADRRATPGTSDADEGRPAVDTAASLAPLLSLACLLLPGALRRRAVGRIRVILDDLGKLLLVACLALGGAALGGRILGGILRDSQVQPEDGLRMTGVQDTPDARRSAHSSALR